MVLPICCQIVDGVAQTSDRSLSAALDCRSDGSVFESDRPGCSHYSQPGCHRKMGFASFDASGWSRFAGRKALRENPQSQGNLGKAGVGGIRKSEAVERPVTREVLGKPRLSIGN